MAAAFGDPVVPPGAEPPRAESRRLPPDVVVPGGELIHVQGQRAVCRNCRMVLEPDLCPGHIARPGPERRYVLHEPRWTSVLVHHEVPPVLGTVFQGVQANVPVVWHRRGHQQGSAAALFPCQGWPASTCTPIHSSQSAACSAAWAHCSSVITSHTGVGAWGRGRRARAMPRPHWAHGARLRRGLHGECT